MYRKSGLYKGKYDPEYYQKYGKKYQRERRSREQRDRKYAKFSEMNSFKSFVYMWVYQQGMSMHDFCKKAGIYDCTLSRWLNLERTIPVTWFCRLAKELDMTMDELYAIYSQALSELKEEERYSNPEEE